MRARKGRKLMAMTLRGKEGKIRKGRKQSEKRWKGEVRRDEGKGTVTREREGKGRAAKEGHEGERREKIKVR